MSVSVSVNPMDNNDGTRTISRNGGGGFSDNEAMDSVNSGSNVLAGVARALIDADSTDEPQTGAASPTRSVALSQHRRSGSEPAGCTPTDTNR